MSASSASRPQSGCDTDSKRSESPRIKLHSPITLPLERHEKPSSPWRLSMGRNILADGGKEGSGHKWGKGKGKELHDAARRGSSGNLKSAEGQSSKRHSSTQEGVLPQSRSGKTKLNLLNPLNLLARRRSGQFLSSKTESASLGLPALPDDYDPRIRGKVVHDFSSPRPRSYASGTKTYQQERPATNTGFSGGNVSNLHKSNHEPEQPDNRQHENGEAVEEGGKSTSQSMECAPSPVAQSEERAPAPSSPSAEAQQEQVPSIQLSTEGVSAPQSNPLSRSSTAREGSCGLPRHLHSVASRFSFDMAGMESSSQEKILEEKHKEKEAARKAKVQESRLYDSDSEDFDYDAMMDDDGLEEKIPGVNADDEGYEQGGFPGHAHPSNATTSKQFIPVLSPLVSNPVSPLDLNSAQPSPGPWPHNAGAPENNNLAPPGLQMGAPTQTSPDIDSPAPQPLRTENNEQPSQGLTGDDFYYDDGMFDDVMDAMGEEEQFDESIFDDPNSHLYERKVKDNEDNSKPLPPVPEFEAPESRRYSIDSDEDFGYVNNQKADASLQGEALTANNLDAFHSALADVASQVALKEKIERSASGSEASIKHGSSPQTTDSQPELTADESRVSQTANSMTFDDFDFTDMGGLDEDDAIIAAANAEALENDDEGIYGQEFGFYAYTNEQDDGERVFGGYFGPRGAQGIHRSHSGRADFQEPSLTPITERSEWSTRNSVVSLAAHQANHSQSSPGLAQMMDSIGSIEDEFTALRKLRRGAFGGSNGSLRSTPSSAATSPPQGHHLSSPLGMNSSTLHDGGERPRPKSWMPGSNSPDGSPLNLNYIGDSNGSPAALRVNKNDGARRVSMPPPLSVDTARANAGPVGARRTASYAT